VLAKGGNTHTAEGGGADTDDEAGSEGVRRWGAGVLDVSVAELTREAVMAGRSMGEVDGKAVLPSTGPPVGGIADILGVSSAEVEMPGAQSPMAIAAGAGWSGACRRISDGGEAGASSGDAAPPSPEAARSLASGEAQIGELGVQVWAGGPRPASPTTRSSLSQVEARRCGSSK